MIFYPRLTQYLSVLSAALMLLCSSTVFAKTVITIDDEFAIAFESGQLDTRNYQGEVFQVEILEDDYVIATADRILVVTEGEYEQPDFVLKKLEIDNLESMQDDISLNARSIRIGDLPLGMLSDEGDSSTQQLDWDKISYEMEFVEFINDIDGVAVFIPRLATMPLKFETLPDGTSFIAAGGVEMPFMQILPTGDSAFAGEFQSWLETANLQHIELSLFARGTNTPLDDDMISKSMFEMRIFGMIDLLLESEFVFSKSAFTKMAGPDFAEMDDDALIELLVSDGRLGELELNLRDQGLLAFIETTGTTPPFELLAGQLQALMTSFLPQTGQSLATPIAKFMTESGALQIKAAPNTPFKFQDFAAAIFMADFVAQQLNLETSHQP